MRALIQDLRHGVRLLRRAPGFAALAVSALAIGIGANTAVFSLVNAVLLKRLPYEDPDRLAIVWERNLLAIASPILCRRATSSTGAR
jgi:putative ABC transport system permease protein